MRLHNNLPGVIEVRGGDDQIVHMGCRWHRQVRRKVRLIGPVEPKSETGTAGEPAAKKEAGIAEGLKVRLYSPSPRQEASTIATALAPVLKRIEDEFLAERSRLTGSPDYPKDAVTALLDRTENALLAALSYQELAALRDYVRQEFQKARMELREIRSSRRMEGLPFSFPPQAVLASLSGLHLAQVRPVPVEEAVSRSSMDRVTTWIDNVLRRLTGMAERHDFLMSLCVTSEPGEGAQVFLRPLSIRDWTAQQITTGEFSTLYRGVYAYKAFRGLTQISCPVKDGCPSLDLVTDPTPSLHCDLTVRACTPHPLPANGCQHHGS
ncbi:MAG TPA: hypothetical protein VFC23_03965 [Thermoanaerobaculia bacterium]|nr:hypothetical protein [Thermoanaerobaculia bacterium]